MKKMVAIMLIVAMFVTCLTACATDAGSATTSPAAEETAQPKETAEASETAAPDAAAEDITVGIVIYASEIPFASDLGAAAVKACQEKGYNYLYLDGQGDMATQQLGVEDWIATNSIDALIIESVDSEGAAGLMEECKNAGIVVVAADTKPNSDVPVAVVQSDNYQMGEQSAQAALDHLKEKNGDYKGTVINVGFDETESMNQRAEGFKSKLAEYDGIEVIDYQVKSSTVTDAQSLCDDFLVTYPEGTIDVIFGVNSAITNGIIASQESAGRKDFVIIGVDDDSEELAALGRDTSTFIQTIAQEPYSMGQESVNILEKYFNGEEFEKKIDAKTTTVTRDNVDDYIASVESIKADLDQYRQ